MFQKRWLIYVLLGLGFGIVDWYFLALLASITKSQAFLRMPDFVHLPLLIILMVFNFGVWLIPAIPIAIFETKHSHSWLHAAFAAILVWSMALVGYYVYYAFLLMFFGLPNLNFMLFSNHQSPTYWADWWPPFKRLIVDQLIEWIVIAIIGGAIVGIASWYLQDVVSKKQTKCVST
jgi:hypothetical protein